MSLSKCAHKHPPFPVTPAYPRRSRCCCRRRRSLPGTTSGYGGPIGGKTVPFRSAACGFCLLCSVTSDSAVCPGHLDFALPLRTQRAARSFDLVLKSTLALLQLTESQHRAELRSEYQQAKGFLKEGKSATSRR